MAVKQSAFPSSVVPYESGPAEPEIKAWRMAQDGAGAEGKTKAEEGVWLAFKISGPAVHWITLCVQTFL